MASFPRKNVFQNTYLSNVIFSVLLLLSIVALINSYFSGALVVGSLAILGKIFYPKSNKNFKSLKTKKNCNSSNTQFSRKASKKKSKTLTPAYQLGKNKADNSNSDSSENISKKTEFTSSDVTSISGLHKIARHVLKHELPPRYKSLSSLPIIISILAKGQLKKDKCSAIFCPQGYAKINYDNKIYFSTWVYAPELAQDLALLQSLLGSIQKLPPNQRPPRIAFPLGCREGVPHVVTAVVDFFKDGRVSCFIFDPISPKGYRKPKNILIKNLKQIFKQNSIRVIEPNLRLEKYDMTKCAIWCFSFHEFLTTASINLKQQNFDHAFLAFIKSKYKKLCQEYHICVSKDPKTKEIAFTNMQYEYLKTLVRNFKTILEDNIKKTKTKPTIEKRRPRNVM